MPCTCAGAVLTLHHTSFDDPRDWQVSNLHTRLRCPHTLPGPCPYQAALSAGGMIAEKGSVVNLLKMAEKKVEETIES